MTPVVNRIHGPNCPIKLAHFVEAVVATWSGKHLTGLVAETPRQSFRQYLEAEMNPGPSFPMADVVWGQTERDRVCASFS